MKIKTSILAFVCISAMAQEDGNFLGTNTEPTPQQVKSARQVMAIKLIEKNEKVFIPKDPWRFIDGKTNYAVNIFSSDRWYEFEGKVIEVQPSGIRVMGGYGKPVYEYQGDYSDGVEFFVANFPYECAENETVKGNLMAKYEGVYTYPTVMGGTHTIRKFDYGIPRGVPNSVVKYQKEQAAAAETAQKAAKEREAKKKAEKKAESDIRLVQWLKVQATNGSVSAQCSLGFHYLNGEGCEINKVLAVYWLTQAANQGDDEASNKLATLKP